MTKRDVEVILKRPFYIGLLLEFVELLLHCWIVLG